MHLLSRLILGWARTRLAVTAERMRPKQSALAHGWKGGRIDLSNNFLKPCKPANELGMSGLTRSLVPLAGWKDALVPRFDTWSTRVGSATLHLARSTAHAAQRLGATLRRMRCWLGSFPHCSSSATGSYVRRYFYLGVPCSGRLN